VKRVTIVLHENDAGARYRPYLVWTYRDLWAGDGLDVSVALGVNDRPDADVLFAHLSVSVTPPEYVGYFAAHGNVVNGGVRDITKRTISDNLVTAPSRDVGPVIVKTNFNTGGGADRILRRSRGYARARGAASWLAHHTPAAMTLRAVARPAPYRIYESVDDVPAEVWDDPARVVERFLPEVDDGLYCLRTYVFCGDRSVAYRSKAVDPVVKSGRILSREVVQPSPDVIAMRERLDFDYGKFDYVINEGRTVVLDTNRCPAIWWRRRKDDELRPALLTAYGVRRFF